MIDAELIRRRFPVVPLETDLMERVVDLEIRLRRAQQRKQNLVKSRDMWRGRALAAEKDARLLRAGVEVLTR